MAAVIQTKELTRVYKSYVKPEGIMGSIRGFWNRQYTEKLALKNINLNIEPGQIIGLVGANGAGKTTLLKVLSGLINPSSGTAEVLGFKPWERDFRFLRRISILLGQKNQLWWDLSPMDSFALLSKIYDLDEKNARHRVMELSELLQCKHVLETQLRRLSLGERMKMEIIGSLLHEPEILFLDEPTIGLDIIAQSNIRQFLQEYVAKKGPTVILTSHYMDDIAKLAHQLLLISKGEIVYSGRVDEFVQRADNTQLLKFRFSAPLASSVNLRNKYPLQMEDQEHSLKISPKDLPWVLSEISQLGQIHDLKIEEADFEEVIRSFLEKESGVF